MTSTNSKITKGADGVYRHPSGQPASFEFQRLMAGDNAAITAATQVLLKDQRRHRAVDRLNAITAANAALFSPLARRARRASAALRTALRRS